MQDITDPTIFVDVKAATRQLIERVQSAPENVKMKIELCGEAAPFLKLGAETKNKHIQITARGCK